MAGRAAKVLEDVEHLGHRLLHRFTTAGPAPPLALSVISVP
jgi:hypothetical protein